MTNRLTPVGSRGGAEAFLVGMPVEISHDDIIGYVAGSGREVSPLPEALSPVPFADMLEFLLDLARRSAFCATDEVADGDMRRDLDEHMDVVARQRAIDDRHAHLGTDLPDDLSDPQAHFAPQHLEPIFRRPDEMIAMMEGGVTTGRIPHIQYPREK